MELETISDGLIDVIKYLDIDSIQNLELVNPSIYNYINTRTRFICEIILNNYGWKLFVIDTDTTKQVSVWRDNFCISFLPDIITENKWKYVVRHMIEYTPINCVHDCVSITNYCCIS